MLFVSVETLHFLLLPPHILPRPVANLQSALSLIDCPVALSHRTFLSGSSFSSSLRCPGIMLFNSFQTSTQKKCIFSPCLSEIAFHTWWIFELNIAQRLKVISPQVREDCSAIFLLVVFVCFACCSFCLFYFH